MFGYERRAFPHRDGTSRIDLSFNLVHAVERQKVVSTMLCNSCIGEEINLSKNIYCWIESTAKVYGWISPWHCEIATSNTYWSSRASLTSLHVPPNEANVLQVRHMLLFTHDVSTCLQNPSSLSAEHAKYGMHVSYGINPWVLANSYALRRYAQMISFKKEDLDDEEWREQYKHIMSRDNTRYASIQAWYTYTRTRSTPAAPSHTTTTVEYVLNGQINVVPHSASCNFDPIREGRHCTCVYSTQEWSAH